MSGVVFNSAIGLGMSTLPTFGMHTSLADEILSHERCRRAKEKGGPGRTAPKDLKLQNVS
jgi:hypothetical protein